MPDRAPRAGDDAHGPRHDDLDERLRAVERALTGTDRDLTEIRTAADRADRLDDLDRRLSAVEDQVADLEAAVQAVRGYVGAIRAVNRDVERRADAALAAARAGGGSPTDAAAPDHEERSTDATPADGESGRDPIAIDAPDGKAHLQEPGSDPGGDPDDCPGSEDSDPDPGPAVGPDRDPDQGVENGPTTEAERPGGERTASDGDPDHHPGPAIGDEDPGESGGIGEGDGIGESDPREDDGTDDHQWPWEREDDESGRKEDRPEREDAHETPRDDRDEDPSPNAGVEEPPSSTPTSDGGQAEPLGDGVSRGHRKETSREEDRRERNHDPEPTNGDAGSTDPAGRRSLDPPSERPIQTGGQPIQTGANRSESTGEFEWPPGDGLDVDRAQPWSVPDVPPSEAPEKEQSLLERIREAL